MLTDLQIKASLSFFQDLGILAMELIFLFMRSHNRLVFSPKPNLIVSIALKNHHYRFYLQSILQFKLSCHFNCLFIRTPQVSWCH